VSEEHEEHAPAHLRGQGDHGSHGGEHATGGHEAMALAYQAEEVGLDHSLEAGSMEDVHERMHSHSAMFQQLIGNSDAEVDILTNLLFPQKTCCAEYTLRTTKQCWFQYRK